MPTDACDKPTVNVTAVVPELPSATAVLTGLIDTTGLLVNRPSRLRRPPVTVMPASEVVGAALPRIALRRSAAVAVGCCDA